MMSQHAHNGLKILMGGCLLYTPILGHAVDDLFSFNEALTNKTPNNKDKNTDKHQFVEVGLLSNNTFLKTITALKHQNSYFLPLNDVLKATGTEAVPFKKNKDKNQTNKLKKFKNSKNTDNEVTNNPDKKTKTPYKIIKTPLGKSKLYLADIKKINNTDYISLQNLKKIGVTARFNQADYAIEVFFGWSKLQSNHNTDKNQQITFDHKPKSFDILNGSVNTSVSYNKIGSDENLISHTNSFGLFGYGFGGTWGLQASNDYFTDTDLSTALSERFDNDKNQNELNNLFWQTYGKKTGVRLGYNSNSHLALNNANYLGAEFAYSNKNIEPHIANSNENTASLIQKNNSDLQHIQGLGPKGGIAQLTINGRPVARIQIALDGKYRFLNLDVHKFANSTIEVDFYEHPLASIPVETKIIKLGKRKSNVATDELFISAGIGSLKKQNFDINNEKTAHLYSEYGFSNRLSARTGIQFWEDSRTINSKNTDKNSNQQTQNTIEKAWLFGLNYLITPNSNWDVSYKRSPDQIAWLSDFNYKHRLINFNYSYLNLQNSQISGNNFVNSSNQTGLNNLANVDNTNQENLVNNEERTNRPDDFLNLNATRNLTTINNTQESTINVNEITDTVNILKSEQHQLSVGFKLSKHANVSVNQNTTKIGTKAQQKKYKTSYKHNTSVYLNGLITNRLKGSLYWQSKENNPSLGLSYNPNGYVQNENKPKKISLENGQSDNSILNRFGVIQASGNRDLIELSTSYQLSPKTNIEMAVLKNKKHFLYKTNAIYKMSEKNKLHGGCSLFETNLGCKAQWTHFNKQGFNVSAGLQHNYLNSIPNSTTLIDNSQFFIQTGFDFWKKPTSGFKLGASQNQNSGHILVTLKHSKTPKIETKKVRFRLNNQLKSGVLINKTATTSSFMIQNIIAGNYQLTLDAEHLPIEYQIDQQKPLNIQVINYAPTIVPLTLSKTFAVSGQVQNKQTNVVIELWQNGKLIKQTQTSDYGFFQIYNLKNGNYVLKAKGFKQHPLFINNSFVMNIKLMPVS